MTLNPCIICGELADATRCPAHQLKPHQPPNRVTGYDHTWRKLSLRARRLQPFCIDCGTTEDLTGDHSPEAWERKAAGKPIRLCDVSVCCRSCNSKRGQAKPSGSNLARPVAQPRAHDPLRPPSLTSDKAKFPSHTLGGIE